MTDVSRIYEEWEWDFIRLAYPEHSIVDIAVIVGRKATTVGYHARRLGLSKPAKIQPGMKFRQFTVIEKMPYMKHRCHVWKCRCTCGVEKELKSNTLLSGGVVSCSCFRKKKKWKGTEHVSGTMFRRIVAGAEARGIEFDLTIEFLDALLVGQRHKCALSGIPIEAIDRRKFTASLDRISSLLPYTENNVQWVHKDVNCMKQAFEQKHFVRMCSLIARTTNGDSDVEHPPFCWQAA